MGRPRINKTVPQQFKDILGTETVDLSEDVFEEVPISEDKLILSKDNPSGLQKYTAFKYKLDNDIAFYRLVESAVIDGRGDDVGALMNIPPSVWKVCKRSRQYQKMEETAKKKIRTESITSARRLANGFKVRLYDFVTAVDFDEVFKRKDDFIDALQKDDKQKVRNLLLNCALTDKDKVIKVSVNEKYFPPNKDAIFRILEAYDEQTWDKELKRKMVPDKKLVVTVSGDHLNRLMGKSKAVKDADFEVQG